MVTTLIPVTLMWLCECVNVEVCEWANIWQNNKSNKSILKLDSIFNAGKNNPSILVYPCIKNPKGMPPVLTSSLVHDKDRSFEFKN